MSHQGNASVAELERSDELDDDHFRSLQLLHPRRETAKLLAMAKSKGKERLEDAESLVKNPVLFLPGESHRTKDDDICRNPVIHHGIFCDGPSCRKLPGQMPIQGSRYKCINCMNTDFCLDCVLDDANPHERSHQLLKCVTKDGLSSFERDLMNKPPALPTEKNPIIKPHRIKSIEMGGINQIDQAFILDALKDRKKETSYIQDPKIRQMVQDLRQITSGPGKRRPEAMKARDRDTDRHDSDPLSDEEMQCISVSFVPKGSPIPEHPHSPQFNPEQERAWAQYKHHQFIRRWGFLTEAEGRDEEWWIEEPVVLDENDPQYLCEMCRHINFNVLLTQRGLPGNQEPGSSRISLYSLAHVLRKCPCAFCTLLRRSFAEKGFPTERCPDDFENQRIEMTVLDEGPKYALRLEISLWVLGARTTEANYELSTPIVIQWLGEASSQPLRSLPTRSEVADLTRLKNWMEICESLRSTAGNTSMTDSKARKPPLLRFIDLRENKVVTLEANHPYACLSYVWGGITQTQYTSVTKAILEAKNGLLDSSLSLPQTIRDAMEVARDIGLYYLWVDALCILQDNTADIARNVALMDKIYGEATLTIVASTNLNPHCGLPGVSTVRRSKKQNREIVQGMHLSTSFHDPRRRLQDIEDSVWNSRAWTYQERHLSSQCVYFTSCEMVFICDYGTFFEDTVPVVDLNYKPSPINEDFNFRPLGVEMRIWADPTQRIYPNKSFQTNDLTSTFVASHPNKDGRYPDPAPIYRITRLPGPHSAGRLQSDAKGLTLWDVYVTAVKNYTLRNLTFDIDAVNAFLGMQGFIAKGVNSKFWYGIPEFAFDRALLWYPRGTVERRKQGDRPLFPSWSWSAWKGSINYRSKGWYNAHDLGPASVIQWYGNMTLESFTDRYPMILNSGQAMENIIDKPESTQVTWPLNAYELMKIPTPDDVWVHQVDQESNQHYYTHEEYPGICFSYPISLPSQEVIERPDSKGLLCFKADVVRIRLCDMSLGEFTAQPPNDHFIQIGINDEKRSSNYRAPWKRILYHQGYRCGFLVLNISFNEIDSALEDQYYLAAISREFLPEIPDLGPKGEWYKAQDPRVAQLRIYAMTKHKNMEAPYSAPDGDALPDMTPREEDGNPHWDEGRFSSRVMYPVYNVLLLRRDGGFSERVGVGRMHFHAFHLANSSAEMIFLS